MMRAHWIMLLFLTVCGNSLCAQGDIDSLKQLLSDINDNMQRVDVLNELASQLYDTDVGEGYKYASDAYELAAAMKYEHGQKLALILMGYRYMVSGDFKQALNHYHRSAAVRPREDDLLAYGYIMAGNVYRSLAMYDSAQYSYSKSITILEKHPNQIYEAFAYKSLSRLYVIQWKNREAEFYLRKAQKIYDATGNIRGQAEVWFYLSDVNKNLTDYELADAYQVKGCEVAHQTNVDFLILLCYKNQGDYYFHLGDQLKALEMLFKAMDILKSKEQPQLLASIYGQLGEVYEEQGQHDVSLKYYFDALKIWERMGVKYEMAKLYSEIGWIYKNQLDFAQAKAYMDKSLVIREEIHDEHGISNSYNVMGVLFYQEGQHEKALAVLQKSLEIRKRIGHREGVSACIFNMAAVYEALGQLDKALELQFEALEIDERIGNKQGLSISYNQIGQVYTKAKKFPEAMRYLNKARDLALQSGSKTLLMNNRLYFSTLYEAQGDFKQALALHKMYTVLNDSIYSEGNAMKLAEMQALYQMEQKNQQIALLNQDKEIQHNQIELQRSQIGQQRTIIIAGIVTLILICYFALKTYQYTSRMRRATREIIEQKEEIQAQSEELIEANQTIASINKDLETKIEERTLDLRQAYKELDTFFYRSSHDFRRPLTTFLGLAEVANITVKDKNALELFAKVKETASNLDKMLIKLQSISDVGAHQLVYKEVLIKEILDDIQTTFSDQLSQRNIKVTCFIELKGTFYSYPAMIKIIMENLVENAIFFSGFVDPFISVKAFDEHGEIVLEVEDNGQGIDPQYHDRIFDMYFRGNERSKGNGLGLYIVKKAVGKLNGTITLTSDIGKGSIVTIRLPSTQNHIESIA
ncbi:MAG TPA: tetratricopeptide repeat-containing sensor histidine kinase [Chryseolinea sp.]|nr:tetratricopeptide repeat-containing sensor histidine kinase [Chryseolinea sp.]